MAITAEWLQQLNDIKNNYFAGQDLKTQQLYQELTNILNYPDACLDIIDEIGNIMRAIPGITPEQIARAEQSTIRLLNENRVTADA